MMNACFFLTATAVFAVAHGYINNFRFKHGNVIKNNILPFSAKITGSYYIDILGTPELTYINDSPFKTAVVAASLIKNRYPPVVCTGDIEELIVAALDHNAEEAGANRLTKLEQLIATDRVTSDHVVSLMSTWSGYVDTSKPKYGCQKLNMEPAPNTKDAYTFTISITFNDYKPVVFVDAMGVGMFNYKRSHETKHLTHSSGNPVRFCGGVDYTGDMYTVEPRPKCPIESSEKARHYGRAIITVYKPNIVSFRWNATRCLQTFTHVHAYENIIGTSRDAWRKHRMVETSESECKEWNNTLSACDTFVYRAIEEGDEIERGYYRKHRSQCELTPQYSQNTAVNEFVSKPDLTYHYSAGSSVTGDFRTATLSRGFIEVSMPTGTLVTPWMNIPKEISRRGYYSINNVTVIWKPIPDNNFCRYVPRFRGEVSYVKYKRGDYNLPIDADSAEEEYTLFLIADQYGALFNVDSSQKIADPSKFGCMPHKFDYRTTLYQTGTDQIIMVTRVDEGFHYMHDTSHIPEDVRHEGTEELLHGAYGKMVYHGDYNGAIQVEHDNQQTLKPTKEGNSSKVLDIQHHYHSVKTTDSRNPPTKPSPPFQPTANDVLNYVNFQRAELQRYNLHVRAMQNCFINQIDWDIYMQMLDLNPSRAISNRLNMAVEASLGGNGFYNVKKCELALNVVVVPTMKTASEERVTINGKSFTVKEIVAHMGVKPDPEKCFTMPLLIFTSPVNGIQIVGQLTLEGLINAHKLAYLEACTKSKAHVFLVNDYGHFFFNYMLNFTETADVIRNVTDRFLRNANPIMVMEGGSLTPKQYRDFSLSKINTLTIVQPTNLKEKEFSHFPTGLFSNDMYSVAEHQSASLGLMKLMEEQNFERFSTRQYSAEWNEDLGSTDSGLFVGLGNFVEGAGDFFMKAGEGGGALLYGLGGGVGQFGKGIGEGVGQAGKGIFEGIGDALQGTFMALGLPLVAIAVLAIIAVIVYKQVCGKKSPPSPEDTPPPPPYYEQRQEIAEGFKKRKGFTFQ